MTDKAVFHNPLLRDSFSQVPNVIIDSELIDLPLKGLYMILLRFAWKDPYCFPSQATIAKRCKLQVRQTRTLLKRLEGEMLVHIERQGLNRPNVYHFLDFYTTRPDIEAEFLERQKTAGPERQDPTRPARHNIAAQEGQGSASYSYTGKEDEKKTPGGISNPSGKEKKYGVYTRAVGAWIEQYLRDKGKVPKPEKIEEVYEKMKRGERLE